MFPKLSLLLGASAAFKVPLSLKKRPHPIVMGDNISMTNYNNDQYYANLYFGSASQTIDILLDSGSSQCWVPVAGCSTSQCPGEKFATSSSNSFVDGTSSETLTYGSGSVTGTWDTDRICLADSLSKCTATSFKILGVTSASGMTGV